MRSLHPIRNCVFSFAVLATTVDLASAQSPKLFGIRLQNGCCQRLDEIDIVSGQPIGGWSYATFSTFHRALTVHGDKFISINSGWPLDRVVSIHPANGVRTEVPLTGTTIGASTGFVSVLSDPSNGRLYYASATELFTLDPWTGQASLVSVFGGTSDVVTCMARDATGVTYALGYHNGAQRYAVYTVDLSTAQLNWVGDIVMPGGGGYFLDFAIPPSGDWWASFWDVGIVPAHRGLWRITPGSFQATQVLALDRPYEGLTFLTPTQQSTYCTAKTNSLGCAPSISGEGFPSPTASSGYAIRASNVRSATNGVLQFGIGGRAAAPFAGGLLCTAGPARRTAVQFSGWPIGASPDCSGHWGLDFNTWMSLHVALPAGVNVQAQWLGRDPGFAPPSNWTLSDALEFTLRP
jgi:hypothetical protein